jgi:hypothetical protein
MPLHYRRLGRPRYELAEPYTIRTEITGADVRMTHIGLNAGGILELAAGFAWDGASGAADTHDILRGSAVHDALYRLIRAGLLSHDARRQADALLYRCCREDGMPWVREVCVWAAVRCFGAPATTTDEGWAPHPCP